MLPRDWPANSRHPRDVSVTKSDMFRTPPSQSPLHALRRVVAFLALTLAARGGASRVATAAGPVWVRLELVENTAEGPAYDRCEIEGILLDRNASPWRGFYGEARAHA